MSQTVTPPPQQMTVMCPACPTGPTGGTLLTFGPDAADIRCATCRKRFRLVSRLVKQTRSERIDAERTRYIVTTYEGGKRTRPRVLEAQGNIRIPGGAWFTFVFRGERLVGMADQTSSFWYPVNVPPPKRPQFRLMYLLLTATVALLVAAQLTRWGPQLADVATQPQGIVVLALGLVFFAAPAILWTLQTLGVGRKKTYLPQTAAQRERNQHF